MNDLEEIKCILNKIEDIENKIKETEVLCKTLSNDLNEIKLGLQKFNKSIKYSLYFDGCSKGNPGLAGAGGVIYKNDEEIFNYSKYLGDNKTNNEAEYSGLLIGIEEAIKLGIKSLDVYGDSQLVIYQMLDKYSVNNIRLKEYHNNIKRKISFFDNIIFTHVLRDKNKRADKLSNDALSL
jgi:ribonuclease HI